MTNVSVERAVTDPEGQLERAFIEEFLRRYGLDLESLHTVPDTEAKQLMTQASTYAAAKLAEIEARAHFVHDMHGREG